MSVTTRSNLTNTVDSINNQARALAFAMPALVYPMFGTGDSIAERKGKTIKWYRHATTTGTTTPLSEDPTWTPETHSVDSVTSELELYGRGKEITELLEKESVFELRPDLLVWAGEDAGKSINRVTRDALLAGATVHYANGKTSANLTTGDTPDLDDFVDMARILKEADAPTFMIGGQECYVAIISPKVEAYLMKTQAFREAVRFAESNRLFSGYIGTIFGVCFVRTSTTQTTTVTGLTVDQSLVMGRDAFGVPSMPLLGGSGSVPEFTGFAPAYDSLMSNSSVLSSMFQVLVTMPGDGSGNGAHGDEWATRFKVAWKAFWKTVIFQPGWIINLRSAN